MNSLQLTQTLAEAFTGIADEVQSLIDRKTILEHKLRYAHEQYQHLADKYAAAGSEVSKILAKLQIPPEINVTQHNVVPLPKRTQAPAGESQVQISLLIREGRKAVSRLSTMMTAEASGSSKETSLSPGMETLTAPSSRSNTLEQDFTVEGRRSSLACPFSKLQRQAAEKAESVARRLSGTSADPTPHRSADPICAAMLEETLSPTNSVNGEKPATRRGSGNANKCPIRYLDQHSPEEIAHYVSTHKHELPRSHEVCVRRYQRTEEQMRKLDAKYGNLTSMIESLSHLHKPMLPEKTSAIADDGQEDEGDEEQERAHPGGDDGQDTIDPSSSKKRVETWAQSVPVSEPGHLEDDEAGEDEERQSHFDRDNTLRDVRLGESPSRPWGIAVPVNHDRQDEQERPPSPAVPVPLPPLQPLQQKQAQGQEEESAPAPRKCPFDHTKMNFSSAPHATPPSPVKQKPDDHEPAASQPHAQPPRVPQPNVQPTFINMPPPPKNNDAVQQTAPPQIVLNISGPVFIGYPMEQAMQLMQGWQR